MRFALRNGRLANASWTTMSRRGQSQSQNIRDAPPGRPWILQRICYNHAYAINSTHDGMHKACEMIACDFASGECEVDLACGTKQIQMGSAATSALPMVVLVALTRRAVARMNTSPAHVSRLWWRCTSDQPTAMPTAATAVDSTSLDARRGRTWAHGMSLRRGPLV